MILRELVKDKGDKANSALVVLRPRSCTIWRAMSWTGGSRLRAERKIGFDSVSRRVEMLIRGVIRLQTERA